MLHLNVVKTFLQNFKYIGFAFCHVELVVVAEWLRRWT